jgi:hypothetical protein
MLQGVTRLYAVWTGGSRCDRVEPDGFLEVEALGTAGLGKPGRGDFKAAKRRGISRSSWIQFPLSRALDQGEG